MTGVGSRSSPTNESDSDQTAMDATSTSTSRLPLVTLEPQIVIQPPEMSTFHSLFMSNGSSSGSGSSSSIINSSINLKSFKEHSSSYRLAHEMDEDFHGASCMVSSNSGTIPHIKYSMDKMYIAKATNIPSALISSTSTSHIYTTPEMTDIAGYPVRRMAKTKVEKEHHVPKYDTYDDSSLNDVNDAPLSAVSSTSSGTVSPNRFNHQSRSFEHKKVLKPYRQRTHRDKRYNHGRWTAEEHALFVKAFQICGRDWSRIAREFVHTRMRSQVASHAQKYLMKLEGNNSTYSVHDGSSSSSSSSSDEM